MLANYIKQLLIICIVLSARRLYLQLEPYWSNFGRNTENRMITSVVKALKSLK